MSAATHPVTAGRDTCNGSCETHAGCDCMPRKVTEQHLDAAIAERRTFVQDAEDERDRENYRQGWRYGLADGVFLGALIVFLAMKLGTLWGVIPC